jgi:hypothetical protein
MNLRPKTILALRNAVSIYQPNGFHTEEQIRKFWQKRLGAMSFLNIRTITPSMVEEIRIKIIKTSKTSA